MYTRCSKTSLVATSGLHTAATIPTAGLCVPGPGSAWDPPRTSIALHFFFHLEDEPHVCHDIL